MTKVDALLKICRFIAQKNLCPATAGNFSVREQSDQMWISGSGRDKHDLNPTDFVLCDLNATLLSGDYQPSDEALLHGKIYQLSPGTQCVLHTHSVPVTVLSLQAPTSSLHFEGYEMQKTIAGFTTHDSVLEISILENSQDMLSLAKQLETKWASISPVFGVIVKGHGLYSWGRSLAEAKRHMEGLEFLIACALEQRRFTS